MDLEARFVGFLRYEFGGAYAWRGYFRDFTVYFNLMENDRIVASSEKGCVKAV